MDAAGVVMGWCSYHLFRAAPWESFLTGVVQPFVASSIETGLIDSFFFVRYWERGPHIRLRLRAGAPGEVDAAVDRHFGDYFRRFPSARAVDRPDWLPNDSVQRIAYEPETERYGGPDRLPVAEQQFEASSRAALAILGDGSATYDRAFGAAIQLHLIMAHAFRLDLASGPAMPGTPFDCNRDELARVHAAIWSALDDGIEFDEAWANRWRDDMRDVALRFGASGPALVARDRAILGSYMHMTNNRLGIRNDDESLLRFILAQSLERIHELV